MLFKRKALDDIFLSPKNQYSKKRQLKQKNILIFAISLIFFTLILGSFFEEKEKSSKEKTPSYLSSLPSRNSQIHYKRTYKEPEYDDIEIKPSPKQNNKAQGLSREALIGSRSAVRLLGNLRAKSKDSIPIRAKVIAYKDSSPDYEGDFKLKEGSLLLGKGRLDPLTERLHITFHNLLVKGKKISIQAKAFMLDGTFGLKGKFSSGELKKYSSRFGSNFIGGVSQGLKEKSVTSSGTLLEIGSIKNAILNGLSLSFLDYAQDKSRRNESPQAKITLEDKTLFFVYFE